jgi:hypothetical protein
MDRLTNTRTVATRAGSAGDEAQSDERVSSEEDH